MSEVKSNSTLSAAQHQAVILLSTGILKRDVAEAVGVTPGTISEWLRTKTFSTHLNREKQSHLDATRDAVRALGLQAVDTIADVLVNGQKDNDKLRAAQMVLDAIGLNEPESTRWSWGIDYSSLL